MFASNLDYENPANTSSAKSMDCSRSVRAVVEVSLLKTVHGRPECLVLYICLLTPNKHVKLTVCVFDLSKRLKKQLNLLTS